ncbi:hypothetical protein [Ruminococcus sp. Marseille-P6503]|uniref:hypothetical protein n=1 Tax=Ruminococcus sp. Marseille-P6503 TaxID=2364796 RepID=UPI000F544008|nr:hypothetical protein [Ruminococcus sp. Marseille-P6503]
MITQEILEDYIKQAALELYLKDGYLIGCQVCERSIMYKFAHYLDNLISKDPAFAGYNLDCEYNRDIMEVKRINCYLNGVYPDIIIHKRGTNNDNLLVIECKTWWNSNTDDDVKKINAFLSPEEHYNYQFGLCLIFTENKENIKWVTYDKKLYDRALRELYK